MKRKYLLMEWRREWGRGRNRGWPLGVGGWTTGNPTREKPGGGRFVVENQHFLLALPQTNFAVKQPGPIQALPLPSWVAFCGPHFLPLQNGIRLSELLAGLGELVKWHAPQGDAGRTLFLLSASIWYQLLDTAGKYSRDSNDASTLTCFNPASWLHKCLKPTFVCSMTGLSHFSGVQSTNLDLFQV